MNRREPWAYVRRLPDGYELRFGGGDGDEFFDRLRSLKARVDWQWRRFDPETKRWYVQLVAGRRLLDWIADEFDDGQRSFVGFSPDDVDDEDEDAPRGRDRRNTAPPPPPPPPPPRADPRQDAWQALWLQPGAPPELVKAAYRVLAVKHHPDRGGDTATMQRLNAAYEQLGKGVA